MWQLNWTDTTLIDWHKLAEVLTYDPRQPMIFNSGVFLLLFLGFSFVYMLLQKRTTARLLFVTLFSYYFYYKSSGVYFFLLGTVTVTDFWLAHVMDRTQSPLKRKGLVATSLLVNLGLLCYFKYTNFFYEMLAPLWGGEFHPLDIFLPVIRPSSGVNPMVVSIHFPSFTAAIDPPLPMWQVMMREPLL